VGARAGPDAVVKKIKFPASAGTRTHDHPTLNNDGSHYVYCSYKLGRLNEGE